MTTTSEAFQLSALQRQVWSWQQESLECCSQGAVEIRGGLDEEALRQALAKVVLRHEILRTTFPRPPGLNVALQAIGEGASPGGAAPFHFRRIEADGAAPQELLARERRHGFDFENGPLLRAALVAPAAGRHLLLLTLPAVCVDARSVALLAGEVGRAYAGALGEDGLSGEVVQYVDFSEWLNESQTSEEGEEGREYWRKAGTARTWPPRLPVEKRTPGTFEPAACTVPAAPDTARRLQDAAGKHGVDEEAFLTAALAVLLWRLTRERRTTFASWTEGREVEPLAGALGLFGRYLPVTCRIDRRSRFCDLAAEIDRGLRASRAWQDYFPGIAAGAGEDLAAPPIAFEFFRWPPAYEAFGARFSLAAHYSCPAPSGLKILAQRRGAELDLTLCYDRSRFHDTGAGRLAGQLAAILEAALRDPVLPAGRTPVLRRAERHLLLTEWNDTARSGTVDRSFAELFAAQAESTPERGALVLGDVWLTYGELARRTEQLARYLRRLGVGPGSRVGLYLDRSLDGVVAILGVLAAGAGYAPLDPELPRGRLELMLEDLDPAVVLTHAARDAELSWGGRHVVRLDADATEVERAAAVPAPRVHPGNLAYALFTSGSTGKPKGALVGHGALVNFALGLGERVYGDLGPLGGDRGGEHGRRPLRVGLNAPLTFDASIKQLAHLLWGHRVEVLPQADRLDTERTVDFALQRRLDVVNTSPSPLQLLLEAGLERTALSWVLVGGEAIDEDAWSTLASSPGMRFYNHYGPTECTANTTACRITGQRPVLGRPLANVRLYILDPELRPVGVALPGEIAIGGTGVGLGYLGQPRMTAERFVPEPFSSRESERLYRTGDLGRYLESGELEFLGRVDHQVKLRGFRIELGEVEVALSRHPDVAAAVAVVRPAPSGGIGGGSTDAAGQPRLLAYAVPRDPGTDADDKLHALPNGLRVAHLDRMETDYLYREIFEESCYFRHGITLAPEACVFDVGAHVGLFTLAVVGSAPAARVYAFEPLPRTFAALQHNAELYGGSRVRTFPFALGSEETSVPFTFYPRFASRSGRSEWADPEGEVEVSRRFLENEARRGVAGAGELAEHAGELLAGAFEGEVEPCRQRRLSDVIREQGVDRIDLLKIDVQRSELEVLRGLDDEDWPKIAQIAMELHDAPGRESEGRREEIRDLLEGHGFEVVVEQDDLLAGTDRYTLFAVQPGERPRDGAPPPPPAFAAASAETALPVSADGLRSYLRDWLPDYMIPADVVLLDELPFTRRGKVDRAALPAPEDVVRDDEDVRTAPRNPFEEVLAAIWAEVLERDAVGVDEDFFELGGHSLLATQLISRVRLAFQIRLPLRSLFEHPTVERLSGEVQRALRDGDRAPAPPIEPVDRDAALPLSFAQQRLWFLEQLLPGTGAYNCPHPLRVAGRLEAAALDATVSEVVRRHEALRTSFPADGGAPRQDIARPRPVRVPVADLGGLDPARRRVEARRLVDEEAWRPFDLAHGPLVRLTLVRLAAQEAVLLFTMHHITSDGWSMRLLVREVAALYRAAVRGEPSPLPELAVQYADFSSWQRRWLAGEVLERELAFWRRQLADAVPLELPTDRPRAPAGGRRNGVELLELPGSLAAELRAASRRQGCTLFMTLLAAFKTLLLRHGAQQDLSVGTPIAGRAALETEELIGFFVNTLVLRTDLGGDPPFADLLSRVREVALAAYSHQDLPFDKLVEELRPERSLHHHPLFQVMFSLDRQASEALELEGLALEPLEPGGLPGKFELALLMADTGEEVSGSLQYATDLFDATTARRLGRHYATLLRGIAAAPEKRLSELPLRSAAEEHQVRSEWNDTASPWPRGETVFGRFAARAAARPQAVAVSFEDGHLSYGELARRACRLAGHLRGLGVGPETVVGLCLERSAELVVAMVGILESGGAYLPLDPDDPPERLARLLADSESPVVVTRPRYADALVESTVHQVAVDSGSTSESDAAPAPIGGPDQLLYVMYTSGSTGRPKGVGATHRGVLRLVLESTFARFGPDESFLLFAPPAFDASTLEIWGTLLHGGRLVVAPPGRRSLEELGRLVERERVSRLWLTAGLFHQVADGPIARLAPLRQLLAGGDVLSPDRVRQALRALPGLVLTNGYGPTENTTFTCCHAMTSPSEVEDPVAVGRPISSTTVYLANRHGRTVPRGTAGELWTGGDGLARGYCARPGLTAARFLPHPWSGEPGSRLYSTGDLARHRRDGSLEFVGRLDAQVKVRGFRVEPGEVEARLEEHPEVGAARVVARPSPDSDKDLVAYVVADEAPPAAELRRFLLDRLPAYMVPGRYVFLDDLPLNARGKVDREALRRLETPAPAVSQAYAAPRTAAEERLCEIWKEVLGTEERLGVHDDFFELGGHSLMATRIVSRVREVFQVEVPLIRLFETPTVAGLARHLEAAGRVSSAPAIERVARDGPIPLSFNQEQIWIVHQLNPASPAYNMPNRYGFRGRLHMPSLERSLAEVARRQEVLRTVYSTHDGEVVQVVEAAGAVDVPLVDLRRLGAERRRAEAERVYVEEAWRPFDLERGPVMRVTYLWLGDEEYEALLTLHHIAADGWSLNVFAADLTALYEACSSGREPALPELPVQYADFARWQRRRFTGPAPAEHMAYWEEQLEGAPEVIDLPTDRPRPAVQTYPGASRRLLLPPALSDELGNLSRERGVTLFMTLLAGFQLLLGRTSAQRDVSVGTPVAGRNRLEIEGLVGYFVNTLVLRTTLAGDPSFGELLARVRRVVLEAADHQDLPFELLVRRLNPQRGLSHTPLFQVFFAFEDATSQDSAPAAADSGGICELAGGKGVAKFDLTLNAAVLERRLAGSWVYNTDLFDDTTIARMAAHLETLLTDAVTAPETRAEDLALLPAPARHQLLAEWNAARVVGAPWQDPIHVLFESTAAREPTTTAVVYQGARLTYGELNRRANQLAHRLRAVGVGPETLVGLAVPRSLEMMVGVLGVLKAGGAYLPLDPAQPAARLEFLVEDASIDLLVTLEPLLDRLPVRDAELLLLDRERAVLGRAPETDPAAGAVSENLACVLYTSGSTGRPKGVALTHRGVAELARGAADIFSRGDLAGLVSTTSIFYSCSLFEFFVPFSLGGGVLLAESALELPADDEVTLVNIVPSAMEELLRGDRLPASATTVNLQGEFPSAELVRRLYERPHVRQVFNGYGPTEVTTYSHFCLMDRATSASPSIGRPIAGTAVYVRDARGELLPAGVPGELHIAGTGLARGYLHRPAWSAEKFLPDPFSPVPGGRGYRTGDLGRLLHDGRIELVGRIDNQVKLRGFRIELREVEETLLRHPQVESAVVLVRDDGGGKRLAAYVSAALPGPAAGELKRFLRGELPDYMVPSVLVVVDELPRLPNGKIDRVRLGSLPVAAPELEEQAEKVAPRDALELELAAIWEEVLEVSPVGVHDDFFELGGHSLMAVRLTSRVESRLGVRLPLATLFERPTVELLAAALRQAGGAAAAADTCLVAIRSAGSQPPLFFVHPAGGNVFCYALLARELGNDQPFYAFQSRGLDGAEELLTDVEAMASTYVGELTETRRTGPWRLGGWSMGGIVAFEMAQQLRARGEEVELVALLDVDAAACSGQAGPDGHEDVLGLLAGFAQDMGLPVERLQLDPSRLDQLEADPDALLRYVHDKARDAGVVPPDLDLPRLRHLFEVFRINTRAMSRYRPRLFPGSLTLFPAAERVGDDPDDPTSGWAGLAAGGVDSSLVPGHHFTLLRNPHVKVLAERLAGALGKLRAGETDSHRGT